MTAGSIHTYNVTCIIYRTAFMVCVNTFRDTCTTRWMLWQATPYLFYGPQGDSRASPYHTFKLHKMTDNLERPILSAFWLKQKIYSLIRIPLNLLVKSNWQWISICGGNWEKSLSSNCQQATTLINDCWQTPICGIRHQWRQMWPTQYMHDYNLICFVLSWLYQQFCEVSFE